MDRGNQAIQLKRRWKDESPDLRTPTFSDFWQADETTYQLCSPPSFMCSQMREMDHQTSLWDLESQNDPVQERPSECFP